MNYLVFTVTEAEYLLGLQKILLKEDLFLYGISKKILPHLREFIYSGVKKGVQR